MESKNPKYLQIKDWHEDDRPREKLEKKGNQSLSDAELLGILIGTGIKNMTAIDLAKNILNAVNNDLYQVSRLSLKDLTKFKGIGKAKAINILAALELGRRRKNAEAPAKQFLKSSKLTYEYLSPILQDLNYEQFVVVFLKQNMEVIGHELISSGGLTSTLVDVRVIFKHALEKNTSLIVLAHNHPSGSTLPSRADFRLTAQIMEAAKIMTITVADHLIYTDQGYYSFSDEGVLDIQILKNKLNKE